MKRILIVANYKGSVGGISGQVEELYRHLQEEEGYEAVIYSLASGSFLKRVWAIARLLIIARHYDVLHIHGCSEWGFLPIVIGVFAGRIWRKRVVVTYHGGGADVFFAKHAAFVRRWLKRASATIVLNGYLEQVFAKYDIPCVVIPNCITLTAAKPHSAYQWTSPRFVSMRHLRELYNIPCILCAYAEVKRQIPACSLTILGDGPLRDELESWVRSHNVADVRFVGQLANAEIATYLADSDIMLSAPHVDNMPVSVMEAMNAGVLVISSRVGGVPYMIQDKVNGLLFEDDDAKEMAEQMLSVVAHPDFAYRLVSHAQQDVKRYTWAEIRDLLLPLYNKHRL